MTATSPMMKDILYITSSKTKFENAAAFLAEHSVSLNNQKIDLPEIQAESAEEVAIQKARDAFEIVQQPLFVNDASWHIPALGGFPGPYMRYITEWLNVDDFLSLTANKTDRAIILRDTIVFTDGETEKVFTNDVTGIILTEPAGHTSGPFINRLVSFEKDGRSLAEMNTVGFSEREAVLWQKFALWLTGR